VRTGHTVTAPRRGVELPAGADRWFAFARRGRSAGRYPYTDRGRGLDHRTPVTTIRGPEEDVVIGSHILCQLGRVAACVLAISLSITPGLAAGDSNEAWTALVKGGHVALIRHGNAPPGYGGDPPGFKIDDCKTQRNLDEQGRGEARALGEAFRNHGRRLEHRDGSRRGRRRPGRAEPALHPADRCPRR